MMVLTPDGWEGNGEGLNRYYPAPVASGQVEIGFRSNRLVGNQKLDDNEPTH
jgi:hypothetical protein